MEKEKARLVIFEKKELLIFVLLMFFLAISSFSLGVKLGKSISYKSDGYIPEDRHNIELKSVEEEIVEKMVNNENTPTDKALENVSEEKALDTEIYNKLKEEFDGLEVAKPQAIGSNKEVFTPKPIKAVEQVKVEPVVSKEIPESNAGEFAGKFTIQLGSFPKKEEAIGFAEGLKIRGYSPIVQEVSLKNRGSWYRVSLGAFESLAQAKDYISQEESLFQGKDYIITEIK